MKIKTEFEYCETRGRTLAKNSFNGTEEVIVSGTLLGYGHNARGLHVDGGYPIVSQAPEKGLSIIFEQDELDDHYKELKRLLPCVDWYILSTPPITGIIEE